MSDSVSFIPLSIPDLRGNEEAYLIQCVRDNWVSSAGPFVAEFENRIADLAGTRHAVALTNGTIALQLALQLVGVRPGDHVIVPDWTFAATANAVINIGAIPYFVDIAEETLTLDARLVAEVLGSADCGVTAVVPVHVAGHPADMDEINTVCERYGVPVVEDAAGALGAKYKGRMVGGLADAAMFSFNGNKVATAGGGGAIVTDNEAWAKRARHISTQARVGQAYSHDEVGSNLRMTNLNAAVAVAQLERLDEMLAARRRIAARYDEAIAGRNDLSSLPCESWAESNAWLYSLRTRSTEAAKSLVAYMNAQSIQAREFWYSLADQAPYAEAPRCLRGVSESISGFTVSLPGSSNLTQAEQDRIIEALSEWSE